MLNVLEVSVLLDKSKALRSESHPRKSGGTRLLYIFKCLAEGCDSEVRVRSSEISKASGLCQSHSHIKRPFESIYRGLFNDWRETPVSLTYEEFIEFTKIDKCHYCGVQINRVPYGTVKGKYTSRSYYLDRKDCYRGYEKDNCVACCTDCNKTRSNRYTYEEFVLLSPILYQIQMNRQMGVAQ